MEDILLEGSRALKTINIDLKYPGGDIGIYFLHINVQKPNEYYALHAHPNFELHYIAAGEGEVGHNTVRISGEINIRSLYE